MSESKSPVWEAIIQAAVAMVLAILAWYLAELGMKSDIERWIAAYPCSAAMAVIIAGSAALLAVAAFFFRAFLNERRKHMSALMNERLNYAIWDHFVGFVRLRSRSGEEDILFNLGARRFFKRTHFTQERAACLSHPICGKCRGHLDLFLTRMDANQVHDEHHPGLYCPTCKEELSDESAGSLSEKATTLLIKYIEEQELSMDEEGRRLLDEARLSEGEAMIELQETGNDKPA